jgi:hypothetical protein
LLERLDAIKNGFPRCFHGFTGKTSAG